MNFICVLVVCFCGMTSRAAAWTESQIVGGEVHIEVAEDASAVVELNLALKVDRGWLSGLEIAQLDEDMVLEAEPTITERVEVDADTVDLKETRELIDGEIHRPNVKVKNGRVWLSFARKDAPRRGRYSVSLKYKTSLAQRRTQLKDGRLTISWTMPGWRSGLDAVVIEMSTPAGSARSDTEHHSVDYNVSEEGHLTVHRWVKAHQPRTIPWQVSVDIDVSRMSSRLAQDAPPKPPTIRAEKEEVVVPWWLSLVAGAFYIIALLKRHAHRELPALVPLPETLRRLLVFSLCLPLGLLPLSANPQLTQIGGWVASGCLALALLLIWLKPGGIRQRELSIFERCSDSFGLGLVVSLVLVSFVLTHQGLDALGVPFVWVMCAALCMFNSGRTRLRTQRKVLSSVRASIAGLARSTLEPVPGGHRLLVSTHRYFDDGLERAEVGFDGRTYCLVVLRADSVAEQWARQYIAPVADCIFELPLARFIELLGVLSTPVSEDLSVTVNTIAEQTYAAAL